MKRSGHGRTSATPSATKPNQRRGIKIVAGCVLGVLILAATWALLAVDLPLTFAYTIASAGPERQYLQVTLNIQAPIFCQKKTIALFLGDKPIEIVSCGDGSRNTLYPAPIADDFIEVPVFRGKTTVLTYQAPLSVAGKHGYRGKAAEDYVVFDGGQFSLLPEAYYRYEEQALAEQIGGVRFAFDFPEDWTQIVPYRAVDHPAWIDFYNLNNDAFAFGAFREQPNDGDTALRIYALTTDTTAYPDGFRALYAYYAALFDAASHPYTVVLLPGGGDAIIGGAGVSAVTATFDPEAKRDWQLLSHRMFHSFYDTRVPRTSVHIPPNLWVNEGLATYYENLSMDALPAALKEKLRIDANREFALLFNRYLYMRIKDPYVYGVYPMDEAQITSGAVTEFLHYTAAPLIVKAFEEAALAMGQPKDSLLNHTIAHDIPVTNGFLFFEAAAALLGNQAQAFSKSYALGAQIPPLWHLSAAQPPKIEILDSLNDMEATMGSWFRTEDADYPVDIIAPETLDQVLENAERSDVVFLPDAVDRQIKAYSPVLYGLLKDYYHRAEKKGVSFDARDLRYQLLGK